MLELAAQGAKVLHDASVEFARKSGIALYARATGKDGGGTRIDFSPERERQVAAVTGQNALIRVKVQGGAAVEQCLQIIEAASIPLTHLDLEGKELRCWFTIADVPDWGEVQKRLDNVLGDQLELGEEGCVTIVGHGIGSNPAVINKARASAGRRRRAAQRGERLAAARDAVVRSAARRRARPGVAQDVHRELERRRRAAYVPPTSAAGHPPLRPAPRTARACRALAANQATSTRVGASR